MANEKDECLATAEYLAADKQDAGKQGERLVAEEQEESPAAGENGHLVAGEEDGYHTDYEEDGVLWPRAKMC